MRAMLPFRPQWCKPAVFAPLRCGAQLRCKSTSSKRWTQRQKSDPFTAKARVEDYKSRAAYKLQEINQKYKLFAPGQTVVDLGFAPGSWSQVAHQLTSPGGRVIGVDLLLAEPPLGVTAIQGNFLDPVTQLEVETILANPTRGRYNENPVKDERVDQEEVGQAVETDLHSGASQGGTDKQDGVEKPNGEVDQDGKAKDGKIKRGKADVVISDMCGIWPILSGFWTDSINHSYRLANTSGIVARDHTSSMDLCDAALVFSIKNLKLNGSFVCKFYTGSEDRDLEARLKKVFRRVNRVKPVASRQESREAYFVARNKMDVRDIASVFS